MTTQSERAARRAADRAYHQLAEDLERICQDAGVSPAALARAAGMSSGFLARIRAGTARPTIDTYARMASALGADLSTRVYPNTGPAIHDRHQARILEVLIAALHPRWRVFTEVAVRRPSRGWIDAALHDPPAHLLLATEIESGLRRIEQLVRWSGDKAASLPSWDGWPQLGDEPAVSQLLVVRRSRATRTAAAELERQLRIAYPAHPDDALASLEGTGAWPGPAMVWAVIEGVRTRLVPGR